MGTHSVYHIDKCLCIASSETFDHFNLIMVQEDCSDQGDALVCGEGLGNQPLPGWVFTARKKAVKLTDAGVARMNGKLTGQGVLPRLLKPPGASEVHEPSSVASAPTNRP